MFNDLIGDIEHALYFGDRVSVVYSSGKIIGGYISTATAQSFTVVTDSGKKCRVHISDVLTFDIL